MGYLCKRANSLNWDKLRPYYDGLDPNAFGTLQNSSYHGDLKTALARLHEAKQRKLISPEEYRAYQGDLVNRVDPQKLYGSYRTAQTSDPRFRISMDEDYGQSSFNDAGAFYRNAAERGLMSYEEANKRVNSIQLPSAPAGYEVKRKPIAPPKPLNPNKVTRRNGFNYLPDGSVVGGTRSRPQIFKSEQDAVAAKARGIAQPMPTRATAQKPMPRLPKAPQVNAVAQPVSTMDALNPAPKPVAPQPMAPAPKPVAPTPKPVAPAPKQVAAPKETWTADNTYGEGWMVRTNANGSKTYRSPKAYAAGRGGITVDPTPATAPVTAPTKK